MSELNKDYWENRYQENRTGWDTGAITPPIKTYFNQISNKDVSILIPGAGNAHEAIYLFQNGFKKVYVCDWAPTALSNLQKQIPEFPSNQLLNMDFFLINGQFDYVIEQTFFCALRKNLRAKYAEKVASLLSPNGILTGLLFGIEFEKSGPPFGGTKAEYENYFSPFFDIQIIEPCYNSIPPRAGNELFIKMKRK